jgi:F-type H+-transporting ATPase subunit c
MKNFLRLSFVSLATMLATVPALAEEVAGAAGQRGLYALAAAIAISVAVVGGALGQGRAVASALDGIARNPSAQPKIFTSMILGLALIESLVIFALLIAFNLSGKA